MKLQNVQKVGIVLILFISVAAVALLKPSGNHPSNERSSTAPVSARNAARVPRLLDLGSTTCIPCKMMQPVLEDLRKDYAGNLQVDFINITEDRSAAEKYGVETIPTQIIFDASGKELFRHTGFYSKQDLLARFEALGVKL